jgi:hypothetical protein
MVLTLPVTLALTGAVLALAVFAGWRGARPWDPREGVRMAPWRLIMVLSGAILFVLVIHLAALAGLIRPA